MAAGSIVIDLLMKTGSFETDTKRAEKRLTELRREATKVGKAIGTAFLGFAAASAAAVQGSINLLDATSKAAQAAGLTTESFSALAYAANLSGVESTEFGSAMQKLSRTAAEAASGTAQYAEAFDALGISVKNSDGSLKNTDKLMGELADKFSQYEDGATKTALAQDIFGKSGAKLIPLLNGGSQGLSDMAAEASALGLVLDTQTSKAAEAFNDNVTRLGSVAQGLTTKIAAELLPTLVNLSAQLFDSAKNSGALDRAARAAATGVKFLLSAGILVGAVFKSIGEFIGGVAAQVVALFQGEFRQAMQIGSEATADFIGNLEAAGAAVGSVWAKTGDKVEAAAETTGTKIAAPLAVAVKKVKVSVDKIAKEAERAAKVVEDKIGGIAREIASFGMSEEQLVLFDLRLAGASPEQIEKAKSLLLGLKQLRDDDAAQEATFEAAKALEAQLKAMDAATPTAKIGAQRDAMLLLADAYEKGRYGLVGSAEAMEKYSEAAQSFLGIDPSAGKGEDPIAASLSDSLTEGIINGFRDGKNAASIFLSELKAQFGKTVLKPLIEPIAKAGSALIGSALSAITGGLLSFDGGGDTPKGPRAGGLDGKGGFLAMLHTDEGVIDYTKPAPARSGGGSGGRPIMVTQNFTVGDVASVSMVRQAVAGSEQRIASGIGRSMRYGGALS